MSPPACSINRRRFLKHSAWGLGLGVSWSAIPSVGAEALQRGPLEPAADEQVVLFQGDSITDAGRDRNDQAANQHHSLGHGYVALAAAHLLGEYPAASYRCYNRGISGNKVFQLADRWDEDSLDLQPDVLSILIGVNDFWHAMDGGYDGTVEVYERDYRNLLDRTKAALPDVTLILGEPFAVEGGSAIDERWAEFDAYRAAAKRIADDYADAWIPYQSVFDEALRKAPAEYWCPDGVHPSMPGNHLMAQAWLDAFRSTMT